ncbi:MAG: hypothetical protein LGR52_10720 [Candidatus Thiosymbion ectosymbiont of Robbea hypermnestra]|nr:hypothetical protein [Candidatus Thiosymbion ectosymbiont of Robbea hypermnestra]
MKIDHYFFGRLHGLAGETPQADSVSQIDAKGTTLTHDDGLRVCIGLPMLVVIPWL